MSAPPFSFYIEIHTHTTDFENCLTAYAGRFPDLCKQTDEEMELGYKSFEIDKGRFCFRLTAPYSEEWRGSARRYARESNTADRLR